MHMDVDTMIQDDTSFHQSAYGEFDCSPSTKFRILSL